MFLDDTPAFPMYSWQSLCFSGEINFDVFRSAYVEAMARHRLLNAAVETRSKRFYWRFFEEPPAIVERVRRLGEPARADRIDIRSEAGTRIFFDRMKDESGRDAGTQIGFQVHHSAADAMGVFAFMADILLGYARKIGDVDLPLPPISDSSMRVRGDYGLTARKYISRFWPLARTTGALVFRFPEPLVPVPAPEKEKPIGAYPSGRFFELSADETTAYCQTAKRLRLTVNDLLLRDLFLATAEFMNEENGDSNGPIRIAMPINMRRDIHEGMFATNMVSMVFLDRRRKEIVDTEEFAVGIHRSTEYIKRNELGMTLLRNLTGRRVLPGGIQMELAMNRCWSTTVLSNLGRIFDTLPLVRDEQGRIKLGGALLERYFGTPPLRYKTLAAWGIWFYAGRISLGVRWDERFLTESARERVFETCRRRILKTVS